MNVLTDEEIDTITDKQWDGREIAAAHRAYARAIEAAVIRKLAAGVSVEPAAWAVGWILNDLKDGDFAEITRSKEEQEDVPLYTATATAAARVQENERCLALMDAIGCDWRDAGDMAKFYATNYLREAIRALLGKEQS